jgi:hypothetical protein
VALAAVEAAFEANGALPVTVTSGALTAAWVATSTAGEAFSLRI